MTWICPRCQHENEDLGTASRERVATDAWGKPLDGERLVGVECICGLTRAGWIAGTLEYQYPIDGGFVQVKSGITRVHKALPQDPNEYTPMEESEIVREYAGDRFDIVSLAP